MRNGLISKNVAYEFGFNKWFTMNYGFHFSCEYVPRGDHRGFYFSCYLFSVGFECNVYDIRHENEIEAKIKAWTPETDMFIMRRR